MFTFLTMLLVVLIGIALAIFGIVAVIAGTVWLLWPVAVAAVVSIAVGYYLGKKRRNELPGD